MSNTKPLCLKNSEADLYRQLSYFCYVLDATRCLEKVHINLTMYFFLLSNRTYAIAGLILTTLDVGGPEGKPALPESLEQ